MRDRLKRLLNDQANASFARLGYSSRMGAEAKRQAWWWLQSRSQALARGGGLLGGWGVLWTHAGYAELVAIEVPSAGHGEVTVELLASIVSPGTERAQMMRLPNAQVSMPFRPGYSAAGRVIATGADVSHVRVGDLVAVTDAPHASVATVPTTSVYPVPAGVGVEDAAMVKLGVISGQAVRLAGLVPGERVCVLGAGLVGALAQRLAAAGGAGPVTVVATSRSKEARARAGGAAEFLVADAEPDRIAALDASVVIEATGDPNVLDLAVAAAGEAARLVMLGSPRGVTPEVPIEAIRDRRLTLIGAHVLTLAHEGRASGTDALRREAEAFLEALADGRLRVDDLVDVVIDPRDVGAFYRELPRARDLVGARIDWSLLPRAERLGAGRLWRVPDVSGRGVEADRRALPPAGRRRGAAPGAETDPFADASGRLRVGLLGCGDIAGANAAAVAAAPNTELVACYDPVRDLAADVAHAHGADVAPAAESLIERPDLDAVLLSVPHHLHAPLALQAIAAGRHVIVEKPLANNLAAATEISDAAERAGVVLSVCFPHRYQASVVAARRLIDAGALGDFGGMLMKLLVDKSPSYRLSGFSGRSVSTWRGSRQRSGGGVLIMNLSHYIDLIRHLVGMDADRLTAMAQAVDEPAEVEDTVSVGVRFPGGAVGSLFGCSAVRGTVSIELRLWGSNGHLVIESEPRAWTLKAVDGLRPARWQTFGAQPDRDIRAIFLSRLATAIDQDREPDVTAADGLAVQAFIEAAYQSSDLGLSVSPAEALAQVRAETAIGPPREPVGREAPVLAEATR